MKFPETPAVVTFCLGSSDDSGAGRMALYFARGFGRQGWRVSAVCPEPVAGAASIVDRLAAEGVDVELVPPFGGRLDRAVLRRFADHFRRQGSWLVVSLHQQDMKFAGLAARQAGVPYVASGQNTFTFSGGRLRQLASRWVLGWILQRSCSEVVATSDRVAGEFRRLLRYRGPLSVLPNGVDTRPIREARPARDEVRRSLGYPPDALVFVSVGRITRQKNQLGLVEAFHQAFGARAAAHLLLVGGVLEQGGPREEDRSYGQALRARVEALGLADRVQVTGWRRDVPRLLAAGDVYVQASLWEGSPLAVVEAMAAGLPAVVADNGGVLPEFRPGLHGWIVPAGDPAPLVAALRAAAALPPETRATLGARAAELAVGSYDATGVAARFFELASRHAAVPGRPREPLRQPAATRADPRPAAPNR